MYGSVNYRGTIYLLIVLGAQINNSTSPASSTVDPLISDCYLYHAGNSLDVPIADLKRSRAIYWLEYLELERGYRDSLVSVANAENESEYVNRSRNSRPEEREGSYERKEAAKGSLEQNSEARNRARKRWQEHSQYHQQRVSAQDQIQIVVEDIAISDYVRLAFRAG